MRRRPCVDSLEQEPDARSGILIAHTEQAEYPSLQGRVAYPHAAAAKLGAVHDHVVGQRSYGQRIAFQLAHIVRMRCREWMMHRSKHSGARIAAKQRKIGYPEHTCRPIGYEAQPTRDFLANAVR